MFFHEFKFCIIEVEMCHFKNVIHGRFFLVIIVQSLLCLFWDNTSFIEITFLTTKNVFLHTVSPSIAFCFSQKKVPKIHVINKII